MSQDASRQSLGQGVDVGWILSNLRRSKTERFFDRTDTADIDELIVERHRAASTVVTSDRDPMEWIAFMAEPLLAQSVIDRLQSAAYELVREGSPVDVDRNQ